MDKVLIKGLGVKTVIGIHDWERDIRQQLLIDMELATDIRPAASDDDINHTLNYQLISERIIEVVEQSSYGLIETLAERLAALLMSEFSVPWLTLTVRKPDAIAEAEYVGVTIERGRKP
jgi:dihydroneopterin aldolase